MDVSQITDRLFIGSQPEAKAYDAFRNKGISLLINTRHETPPHPDVHNTPLQFLWIRTRDNPLFPIPMNALAQGAQAALDEFQRGGRVLVYCAHGRHRSVAMASAVLIAQGYSAADAMHLIKTRRPKADPYLFYIRWRIQKFEKYWADHR